jgi:hypothetical protein
MHAAPVPDDDRGAKVRGGHLGRSTHHWQHPTHYLTTSNADLLDALLACSLLRIRPLVWSLTGRGAARTAPRDHALIQTPSWL